MSIKSEIARRTWADPVIREKRIQGLRVAGKKLSRKIHSSESAKRFWSNLSETDREKRRELLRRIWAKPENRIKILRLCRNNLKKMGSLEARLKRKNKDMTFETRIRRSIAARLRIAKILKKRKVWSGLNYFFYNKIREAGLNPKHEYQIGSYVVDFCFPEERLVIEADGDFWHANPDFLKERGRTELYQVQKKMKRLDKAKNTYLINHGWRVLRFWERDIKNNPVKCISKIKEVLNGCSI